ncbi:MAG: glutamate-5-semialdehyde dehydrogenase [Bacteroidales bacterium]|jgi:glutamate-5-semialdehyde dehydrogenase|nr:glutamate-5-semialdehyde dehydrogenase [Bacteroidales bacterium]
MNIEQAAQAAKQASIELAASTTELKQAALERIAQRLQEHAHEIAEANKKDLARSEAENLAAPLLKRLKFDEAKVAEVVQGIHSLIRLPEPVGETLMSTELDKGLELYKVSCPIGVIGVIFESRPDALVQISTLCLKSGNAVLLKGGSEALETNRVLAHIIEQASAEVGIAHGWIQLLETRNDVNEMLKMDKSIDLIIPRGSNEFVQYIMNNSNIPVLGHADGICHVYIDNDADIAMAVEVATDSKCQYVAVCNAAETILVHSDVAGEFLPKFVEATKKYNLEIFGDPRTQAIIACQPATDESWKTEYLDYKVSIKIVDSIDEALQHINTYGSGHTEVIVSRNAHNAEAFMNRADSGNVFWNCSTRFSDGFRYGLGAEVGISTNKIHARGPVGLEGLLIYKWKLKGSGQTVAPYADGSKAFTHVKMNKDFEM